MFHINMRSIGKKQGFRLNLNMYIGKISSRRGGALQGRGGEKNKNHVGQPQGERNGQVSLVGDVLAADVKNPIGHDEAQTNDQIARLGVAPVGGDSETDADQGEEQAADGQGPSFMKFDRELSPSRLI